ncbi:MAG TPA: hypothetical protein VFQ77_12425 [Pseudonocardiaceae bacterium]|nr:hypothetical protein [Pseudonocardiaceae bacterium]
MLGPGCPTQASSPDPEALLIALAVVGAAVLVLIVLLGVAHGRDQRPVRARPRPRHTASGPPNPAAVTVAEIGHRLGREAAQARAARTRPPRRIQVVARIPAIPCFRSSSPSRRTPRPPPPSTRLAPTRTTPGDLGRRLIVCMVTSRRVAPGVRLAGLADAETISQLLHDFNREFGAPTRRTRRRQAAGLSRTR